MPWDFESEVAAFFTNYGSAAIRDAAAFAACWAYPAHSTRFDQVTKKIQPFPIRTMEEFTRAVATTDRLFRAWGFRSSHIDVVAVSKLSEGLVQARAHWTFLDASAEPLADADAVYTLGRFEEGLRIVQAIWLGVVPRSVPSVAQSRS